RENLTCDGERAMAFGVAIDIVLRQYPAEFLHELPAMADLWALTRRGRLLWLNDPRACAVQAKSLLALTWRWALDGRLSRSDARLVRDHVPPTGVAADTIWLERAEARPEDWVIKPVLGRYSQGVALGVASTAEDWQRALQAAAARPYDYVVQAYVPPRRRWLPAAGGARAGYVNWGVALAEGTVVGLLPRCQPTALTEEWSTWWAPLRTGAVAPRAPVVRRPRATMASRRGPGRAWLSIADRCAMAGYTNVWTHGMANVTLAALGMAPADWDELSHATVLLGRVAARAVAQLRDPALVRVLGIPGVVAPLVARAAAGGAPNFLSRFDWARTTDGRWQLLEI